MYGLNEICPYSINCSLFRITILLSPPRYFRVTGVRLSFPDRKATDRREPRGTFVRLLSTVTVMHYGACSYVCACSWKKTALVSSGGGQKKKVKIGGKTTAAVLHYIICLRTETAYGDRAHAPTSFAIWPAFSFSLYSMMPYRTTVLRTMHYTSNTRKGVCG